MRYASIPSGLFSRNREKLTALLPLHSLAILNAGDEMPRNGDQYYPYRPQSDLFYLTGIAQEKTRLLLCPSHPNPAMREILFILRPDETLEIWEGKKLTPGEARKISGIQEISFLDQWESVLRECMVFAAEVFLNRNEYPKFYTPVISADDRFTSELRSAFPLHRYSRLAPLLWQLRMLKEPEEVMLMQEACRVTGVAFRKVMQQLKPGMSEYEVEAELTYEFVRNACGHAYQPIIAGGANACSLHYHANDQVLGDGDLLLMDFGAEYANYAADCSRTLPVNGRFTPRQRQVYEAVLRLQRHALTLLVPGNTINQVNAELNSLAEREMINLGLFTDAELAAQDPANPLRKRYLMHGVSHFLGLDVHDVGGRDEPFRPGMVLTFEPAIYIYEEGLGIRLEDNIVVGYPSWNMMADIPIDPDEIEEIMQS